MQDYKKLMKKIIKKSFPEIRGKIFIYRMKLLVGKAGALPLPFKLNFIFMTPKLDNKSKKYINGILAHELSHILRNEKSSWLKNISVLYKYWISSKKFRKNEEVETDKLAIRKGFFNEIYEISKDRKSKMGKKYYLTSKEILNYYNKLKITQP
jgi:hypothetical protein